jgi:hypothetical protein
MLDRAEIERMLCDAVSGDLDEEALLRLQGVLQDMAEEDDRISQVLDDLLLELDDLIRRAEELEGLDDMECREIGGSHTRGDEGW